ncbi:MAG: DUF3656 domain-containing protein [Methanobacteriaceae archaeon]|nr:DUF3656 domain-containing protein [Methanobacteriaceae archaeon]
MAVNKKQNLVVNASYKLGEKTINFSYKSDYKLQKAENKPLTEEIIQEQMEKTGNTPFIINNVQITNLPNNVFMPIGKLNKIRRKITDHGTEELLKQYIPQEDKTSPLKKIIKSYIKECKENIPKIKPSKYLALNVYVDNLNLLKVVNKYPVTRIYFDPSFIYSNKTDYFNNIEEILRQAVKITMDKELVWVLSSFTSDEDLKKIKQVYTNLKKDEINISIMGDFPSLTRTFDTNIYGSHNLNIWNNYSVAMLNKNGFKGATISSELSNKEVKELLEKSQQYNTKLELIIHGNQEIMVTKDNFSNLKDGNDLEIITGEYVTLEDKKNKAKFKIYFDYNNQSHFFNNDCLSLIDEIPMIQKMGIENVTLDCRFTKEKYLSKVLSVYIQKLEDIETKNKYIKHIEDISYSKLNKGNFINERILENKKRKRMISQNRTKNLNKDKKARKKRRKYD